MRPNPRPWPERTPEAAEPFLSETAAPERPDDHSAFESGLNVIKADLDRTDREEEEAIRLRWVRAKEDEMCEHMRALIAYCREHNVFVGGCGDCGSPWLLCYACGTRRPKMVDCVDNVFTNEQRR